MYEQQMVEEQQRAFQVAEQQKEFQVEEQRNRPNQDSVPEIVQVKQPSKDRPGIQVLEIPKGSSDDDSDYDLLDKWTNPNRPTSSIHLDPTPAIDTSFAKQRPQPLARPVSYNPQHLLSPEWTASPTTLTPEPPIPRPVPSVLDSLQKLRRNSDSSDGSCECEHVHPAVRNYQHTQQARDVQEGRPISYHPQSSTSLDSPPLQQRPRPTSFANYSQRNRSGTKIASSRGLRNNSCPTTSPRPASSSIPRSIAGEKIENDTVCRCGGDNEVSPPTPVTFETPVFHSPSTLSVGQAAPATPVRSPFDTIDNNTGEKTKAEKKSRSRWSSIPQAFKNFGARRRTSSTAGTQERPKFATVVDDVRQMKLTEENLHRYESEACPVSITPKRQSAIEFAPTPAYSPMNTNASPSSPHLVMPLPAPFAPWANDAPPSPAATTAGHRRSSSSGAVSLSPKQTPLRLSVDIPHQIRPSSMHSYSSRPAPPTTAATTPTTDIPRYMTPASRRNTPAQERTCILCKAVRPTTEFVARRITQNCWHEPATCVECLVGWVSTCARGVKGLEGCTCPECGEGMARDDVIAFMGVSPL